MRLPTVLTAGVVVSAEGPQGGGWRPRRLRLQRSHAFLFVGAEGPLWEAASLAVCGRSARVHFVFRSSSWVMGPGEPRNVRGLDALLLISSAQIECGSDRIGHKRCKRSVNETSKQEHRQTDADAHADSEGLPFQENMPLKCEFPLENATEHPLGTATGNPR